MEIVTNLKGADNHLVLLPIQLQDNSVITSDKGKYQVTLTVVYEGANNDLVLCSIAVSKNGVLTDTFQSTLRNCPNDGCKALYDVDQLSSLSNFKKVQRKIRLEDEFEPDTVDKLLDAAHERSNLIRVCSMCNRTYRFSDTTDTVTWRGPLRLIVGIVSELVESLSFNTSIAFYRNKSGAAVRKLRNELVPSKNANFDMANYKQGLKSARDYDTCVMLDCSKLNLLLRNQKSSDIIRGLFQ